jgi:hypothetical protein
MSVPSVSTIVLAAALIQCGSEEQTTPVTAEPAEVVRVESPAPVLAPAHGGTVMRLGAHPVEVVGTNGGEVRAYVRSSQAPQPDRVRLTASIPDARGARRPVVLVWNPRAGYYAGRVRGAPLAAGPIDMTMVVGSERFEASSPTYVIVTAPQAPHVREVQVVERADDPEVVMVEESRDTVLVERPRPTIVVQRPQPTIVVERPRPTIVVERPRPTIVVERPRPTIVVERPRPQVVVVPQRPDVIVVEERRGKFKHRGRGHGHGRHGD